jgi:3-methylcrotonyl-CoA carboxylase alpha subunit
VRAERTGAEVTVEVRGTTYTVRVTRCRDGHIGFIVDGRSISGAYARSARGLEVQLDGASHLLTRPDPDAETWGDAAGGGASDGRVLTPMPGKVVAVNVAPEDRVTAGQALLVVESMKMQNDIVAPADGKVAKIHHEVGDNVDFGDVLVELELDGAEA